MSTQPQQKSMFAGDGVSWAWLAVLLYAAVCLTTFLCVRPDRPDWMHTVAFYESHPIVGDWNSGIYHDRLKSAALGGPCEWVDRISLGHVVDCPDTVAAAKAGYRPCKACFGPETAEQQGIGPYRPDPR